MLMKLCLKITQVLLVLRKICFRYIKIIQIVHIIIIDAFFISIFDWYPEICWWAPWNDQQVVLVVQHLPNGGEWHWPTQCSPVFHCHQFLQLPTALNWRLDLLHSTFSSSSGFPLGMASSSRNQWQEVHPHIWGLVHLASIHQWLQIQQWDTPHCIYGYYQHPDRQFPDFCHWS